MSTIPGNSCRGGRGGGRGGAAGTGTVAGAEAGSSDCSDDGRRRASGRPPCGACHPKSPFIA
eukprot:5975105-Prorocentrum_lima.AAC.1